MSQLPRFYVEQKEVFRDRFLITSPDVCKHLRQILRIGKGARIVLFDGQGNEYEGEIRYLDKSQVSGIVDKKWVLTENWPNIILAQALPKAGKADDIVRMNTEAGVREFVFFKSEYSIPPKESYDQKKVERLQRVANEAGRQSERGYLPSIGPAISFDELLEAEIDLKLMLHSRNVEGAMSLTQIRAAFPNPASILVAIGPEGGFSPIEVSQAQEKGFKIVYLNTPILRTETAGLLAAGYLVLEYGEKNDQAVTKELYK